MHGTFQTNGGKPVNGPNALGPNNGATSAPAGSTSTVSRSPLPDSDPRVKAYIDG